MKQHQLMQERKRRKEERGKHSNGPSGKNKEECSIISPSNTEEKKKRKEKEQESEAPQRIISENEGKRNDSINVKKTNEKRGEPSICLQ